jgi:outer membrane protein TolC
VSAKPDKKALAVVRLVALLGTVAVGSSFHTGCWAQTLMDAYRKAQTADAQYAIAHKTFEASLEKLPQARAGLLPSLNLSGNKNRQSGEASFADAAYILVVDAATHAAFAALGQLGELPAGGCPGKHGPGTAGSGGAGFDFAHCAKLF